MQNLGLEESRACRFWGFQKSTSCCKTWDEIARACSAAGTM